MSHRLPHPQLDAAASTADSLAWHLSHFARQMSHTLATLFEHSSVQRAVDEHTAAAQSGVLSTWTTSDIADMIAQTLVYGLFTAHVCKDTPCKTGIRLFQNNSTGYADRPQTSAHKLITLTGIVDELALSLFPPEHPLHHLLHLITSDEQVAFLVAQCSHLLAQSNVPALFADFGKATCRHDPVVHFYETFLAAYHPKQREQRGVYSTPQPIVSYMVRSVDYLLRTRFNCAPGLADERVSIVDPAMGTATFLHTIIEQICLNPNEHPLAHTRHHYATHTPLSRLIGFEVLLTPYTIAHLKLRMLLNQVGSSSGGTGAQVQIYLANTLAADTLHSTARDDQILVVIGNPPYARTSANKGRWEEQIRERYYPEDTTREQNPKPLLDDYVKFICCGQTWVEQNGRGILALVTNHAYLDNPTFRTMRHSLLQTFSAIYILNLHGNSRKREITPDGSRDENVFDIQQGTAISIFISVKGQPAAATVHYADVWGAREEQPGKVGKYSWLDSHDLATTAWTTLSPQPPLYLFVPQDTALLAEYERGERISDIFPLGSTGIKTHRDQFAFAVDREQLAARIAHFRDPSVTDEELRRMYDLHDTRDWKLAKRRNALRSVRDWQHAIRQCLYRPFDIRSLYAHRDVVELPRQKVMCHMEAGPNIGLISVRQVAEAAFNHAFVTETIAECRSMLSNRGAAFLFPLYRYTQSTIAGKTERQRHPNLNPAYIAALEHGLGLTFVASGRGDLQRTIGAEDIFHYIYALLYSPVYRQRYAEFLKLEFPRIPHTSDARLFAALARKGAELVDLHLLRLPGSKGIGGAGGTALLSDPCSLGIRFAGEGSNKVERIRYIPPSGGQPGYVAINANQHFEGIEPAIWSLLVGGYQPLAKWLKERKGRTLSADERQHSMRIAVALRETHRLMSEIDALLQPWPFSCGPAAIT